MRTSNIKINSSLKKQITQTFAQLLTDLTRPDEAKKFLNDFFNKDELEIYAKRLAIAYWLKKGRSYANIKTNLKVSSTTIASVQEMLKKPGLVLALKKIEAEEWANKWVGKIKKLGTRY